ncbi:MAG: hypothetical protein V4653_09120 [Pseudomonadota bacterium]
MSEQDSTAKRRGFLRSLGIGAAAAAATPALAQRADSVPAGDARKENAADRVKTRYQETPHVAAFYRTNRYEQ